MARLFVRHEVEDFDRWKQGYDEFDSVRKENGCTGDAVYRSVENPNDVTVWHDFGSAEQAQTFAGLDELREKMGELGVVGPPQIWITSEA